MSFSLKLFVIICLSTMVVARPLSSTTSTSTLATRLRLEDNNKCWETLFQLQSCTGEIVLFFVNGEAHLGPNCCNALLTIAQECWPNMLTTLGLTSLEVDILRGYCNGASNVDKSLSVHVNASYPSSTTNHNDLF
ncbi:hypothetical protein RJT34_00843 [Clitoria ternatea]|uniref:Prolamin-like domain-containing protein n=1 Tax=Clitoria ternatea TaxID=43366 RepID=A0AAN9Q2Z8_CLITE